VTADAFERYVAEAVGSLPDAIAEQLENVAIVVDEEPPADEDDLLGLYEGGGYLPDLITIYRGPLERAYGHDQALLQEEVRRTVLHEIAHYFGIDDDRLVEIDRY